MQREKQNRNSQNGHTLIKNFSENNETVLRKIYADNFRKVNAFVLQNNGSEPQSKDIYQEAFIVLWEKIRSGQFIPESLSSLNGYLYTIAKNKWMDYLRSARYKKTKILDVSMEMKFQNTEDPDRSEANDEASGRAKRIMDAFKQMGKACKDLLSKVYFEKKSMKEIGFELELDAASARNKKYRCMQKLRELAFNKSKHG